MDWAKKKFSNSAKNMTGVVMDVAGDVAHQTANIGGQVANKAIQAMPQVANAAVSATTKLIPGVGMIPGVAQTTGNMAQAAATPAAKIAGPALQQAGAAVGNAAHDAAVTGANTIAPNRQTPASQGSPFAPPRAHVVPTTPGAFANAQRRGGASPTGIAGRQSTGASPSAPAAVRNQVAAQHGVPPVMPDQKAPAAAQPDDKYLAKVMGSYNPNSALDKRKADAIRNIWKAKGGPVAANQVYADPTYSQIKRASAFATLGKPEMVKQAWLQKKIDGAWNASVKPLGNAIGTAVKGVGNTLGGMARGAWNVGMAVPKAGFSALGGAASGAWNGGIGGMVQGAWDGGMGSLKTDAKDVMAGAKQTANGLGQTVGGTLETVGRAATMPATALYGAATNYGTYQDPNKNGYGINATDKPTPPPAAAQAAAPSPTSTAAVPTPSFDSLTGGKSGSAFSLLGKSANKRVAMQMAMRAAGMGDDAAKAMGPVKSKVKTINSRVSNNSESAKSVKAPSGKPGPQQHLPPALPSSQFGKMDESMRLPQLPQQRPAQLPFNMLAPENASVPASIARNPKAGLGGRYRNLLADHPDILRKLKIGGGVAGGAGLLYGSNRLGHSSGREQGVGEGLDAGLQQGIMAAQSAQPGDPGVMGRIYDLFRGRESGPDAQSILNALNPTREGMVSAILKGQV